MASVRWSHTALKDIENLDNIIAKRILEKVLWLEKNFSTVVPERLHRNLKDLYKLRIGDYRVVYALRKDTITIYAVGHRGNIYKYK